MNLLGREPVIFARQSVENTRRVARELPLRDLRVTRQQGIMRGIFSRSSLSFVPKFVANFVRQEAIEGTGTLSSGQCGSGRRLQFGRGNIEARWTKSRAGLISVSLAAVVTPLWIREARPLLIVAFMHSSSSCHLWGGFLANLETAFESGLYLGEIEAHDASNLDKGNESKLPPVVDCARGSENRLGELFAVQIERLESVVTGIGAYADRRREFCDWN